VTFDANHTMHDLVQTALAAVLPGNITAVATERNTTLPPMRKHYTSVVPDMFFPSTLVMTMPSRIDDDGCIITRAEAVVLITVPVVDAVRADNDIRGYITALVRTFAHKSYGGVEFSVTGYDIDPPDPISESDQLQTGAVTIAATIIESP
jgi:hypothetical protein